MSTAGTQELNFGKDDRTHRVRLRALLADREWHTANELRAVGGARFGSRLHELRRDELLDVECRRISAGVYHYRLVGELERAPLRGRDWKRRALDAEALVKHLEQRLDALGREQSRLQLEQPSHSSEPAAEGT